MWPFHGVFTPDAMPHGWPYRFVWRSRSNALSQARAIVEAAAERAGGGAYQGKFMVALWGCQDALAWRVMAGAAEAIQRDDADFLVMEQTALLVRKADGVLEGLVMTEHLERLAAMTPYGPVPEDDFYA